MRNLKRALSLTLASVMLLGMMVVGSSAAGYPDVTEEENIEAIEVLQTVGVMEGDNNGNFNPDDYVTREQMAVIMSKLLNLDYNYYQGTNPFSDVPSWAAPYVAACAANGITSGIGGGMYGAGQNVNAVQAALMMLKALGYFQYQEDFGDSYILATVKQATEVGLFDMIDSNAQSALTRNEVAQMALNALKSDMVTFTGDVGTKIPTANGDVLVGYKAEYTPRTSTLTKYQAIERRSSDVGGSNNLNRGQYYIQLGEELYNGDLRLNDGAVDDFGRPSRYWEYDGKAIGTYAKKELLRQQWTTKVTGKALFDELGSDVIKNYHFNVTIDGVSIDEKTGTTDNNTVLKTAANSGAPYFDETFMNKTYNKTVGQTGKGVLTQLYVNADTKVVDIAVINTYLAQATGNYNEKKDEVTLKVYALTSTGSGDSEVFYKYEKAWDNSVANSKNRDVSGDDFAIADVKKDDLFLVTAANGVIKTMAEPEVISETSLNAFSRGDYVVSDGTQYDYNTTVDYDPAVLDDYTGISGTQQLKNTSYNLYLDNYGYLIGVKIVEGVKNYVFLTGIDQGTSNLNAKTADAAGILLDGTFINMKIDIRESKTTANEQFKGGPLLNTWCTYTVDKDGVYTLKEVGDWDTMTAVGSKVKSGQYRDYLYTDKSINDKRVSLVAKRTGATANNYVYGNDNSIYIVAEMKQVEIKDAVVKEHNLSNDANTGTTVGANNMLGGPPAAASDLAVGKPAVVISGVESFATGITNVDLRTLKVAEIKNAAKANSDAMKAYPGNVYTLFDNDGYVIAAVVIGEDNGTNKNLVYVNSSNVKKEEYSEANDEWTWVREVIKDGVKTDLTEKGSGVSKLKNTTNGGNMDANMWVQVNLKADGTVKDVTPVYYTDSGMNVGKTVYSGPAMELSTGYGGATTATSSPKGNFVDVLTNVEHAINESNKTTVLYEEVWGSGADATGDTINDATGNTGAAKPAMTKQPYLEGSTLYVNTAAKRGFYVSDSVKCVLIQNVNGTNETFTGEGKDDLKGFLEDLNMDGTTTYRFKISAILTNGRATTVIIHDWVPSGGKPDGSHTGTVEGWVMDVNSPVSEVNAAFADHKDIVIKGDWIPKDNNLTRTLLIPADCTLTIQGDFDAVREKVTVNHAPNTALNKGHLVVDGTYTVSSEVSTEINYKITANKMEILRNDAKTDAGAFQTRGVVINSIVVVENGLTIQNATDNGNVDANGVPRVCEVTVSSTGNLTVEDGGITATVFKTADKADKAKDYTWMKILGTVTVGNNQYANNCFAVNSLNSLHMGLTAVIGGKLFTNGGRVEVGSVAGGVWQQGATDVIKLTNATSVPTSFYQVTKGGTVTTSNQGASETTKTVATDAGSASNTENAIETIPTAAPSVPDDPATTIEVVGDGNEPQIVTIDKTRTPITVTADLNKVAEKINAWLTNKENTFTPANENQTVGGFGISASKTETNNRNLVCVGVVWKAPVREGKTVKSGQCYKLVNGEEQLFVTVKENETGSDGESTVNGIVYWPHLGTIVNTAAEDAPASYAYSGTDVSESATYIIRWTYSDNTVVEQTRQINFNLTPWTPTTAG